MKVSLFIVSVLLLFTGCKSKHSEHKPRLVCTTSIIADGMQELLGDRFEVTSLMGPGVDPHSYNPRPSDIQLLNSAEIIVYNGLHLEGKMVELFEKLRTKKKVYAIADYVPASKLIRSSTVGLTFDPHIWFDPQLWYKGLKGTTNAIASDFKLDEKDIHQKLDALESNFIELQKKLISALKSIPDSSRILITSHDAFHYFGKAFNVQVKALQGVSTTLEPAVKDVIELVNFIVSHKVKALFIEQSVNPKALKSVRESCIAKSHNISVGGTLYSDALGEKNGAAGTYLGMLNANVRTIISGLK